MNSNDIKHKMMSHRTFASAWTDQSTCAAGQKGSDRSAKEATRKVVAATRQLAALEAVLNALGARIPLGKEDAAVGREGVKCIGKNTIVRDVLNEIGQRTQQL